MSGYSPADGADVKSSRIAVFTPTPQDVQTLMHARMHTCTHMCTHTRRRGILGALDFLHQLMGNVHKETIAVRLSGLEE